MKQANCDEVNFWKPGGRTNFKALNEGDLFLFKTHSPRNYIVGGGFFLKFSILPSSLAWDAFGIANGASSLMELNDRVYKYKKTDRFSDPDPQIGCIILSMPFYFDEKDWIPQPNDWNSNIVQGKTYKTSEPVGLSLYEQKVKMIYIDPPYNTGNDFVYKDDYKDRIENYLEQTEQVDSDGNKMSTNTESNGRYHSDWLNMMYPRLKLARNLLKDDGVIFISIDDHEVAQLRKMCDEVFGENNLVAQLIWQRAFSPKNDAKFVSNSHDYVLMVAKSINCFQIGRLPRTEEANARYSNPDNDPRGPWMSSDISVKTYNAAADYPITLPSGRVVETPGQPYLVWS
ncbi:site-specific DNA-methyltransferase [Sporolactobacillus terrae]|uniref:site-specific DNA-methyltransferase n=1 Tax=Sporolactobacillus terrae TaxID=269673 RepID=UPI0018D8D25B|nr:site-specific DNA-methyltransferase [Sporolactobacillus terrae]